MEYSTIQGNLLKKIYLNDEKFALITGENVKKKVSSIIEKNFLENNIQYQWVSAGSASFHSVKQI